MLFNRSVAERFILAQVFPARSWRHFCLKRTSDRSPYLAGAPGSSTHRRRKVQQGNCRPILGISIKTAESHRTRLMRKLDIHELASLVRYAIRRGLVQP